ncbi:phospho-sugar mutase [Psychrobacillus psychrodurans]|uniref:phospho-sugar mutase n=1 Tax=Psychrobacillus psychrodurans TaxID=126157 RepID=UPI0008F1E088|nr:phospho-sugar mutase [Psychrobacillus psychrodurans]MCZ8541923.1 phospho-sugar mutase [Psychrobacillus psychrodurans]SFN14811.1 phosphoglucomutase [Psychrobacillus psychrodurans]
MRYRQLFDQWNNFSELESNWKEDLQLLTKDEKKMEDAFYRDLEFGTGGMRGEIGAGTNRINTYTVRKATTGLASYIKGAGAEAMERGVVIAYDSRRYSPEFALEAANTLASNGIKAYLFNEPRTTPQLSFSVRHLHAFMGIVITASHNPPEYNGYKVYGEDGAQLNLEDAEVVIQHVNDAGDAIHIDQRNPDKKLVIQLDEIMDQAYMDALKTVQENGEFASSSGLKVVFTPLHGASGKTVKRILSEVGYEHISYVEEQMEPNGDFPTVESPNPEEQSAFEYAIQYGEKNGADILIAVDPDGDRVGIAVKTASKYKLLTGNQTGAILIEYLLSQRKAKGNIPANGRVFKTIVTSDLGRVIAEYYSVSTEDVLTGFKFIGEKIKKYEETKEFEFLFGYEESYGYLIKNFARDKDAVQSVLAIIEAASYYKKQGKTLLDVLSHLYERHGFYLEGLRSVTKKGVSGANSIQNLLEQVRVNRITEVAGITVLSQEDYLHSVRTFTDGRETEEIFLPKSNVIKFFLADGSWVCVRPSGTEPKVKYYFGVLSGSEEESSKKLKALQDDFSLKMNRYLEE